MRIIIILVLMLSNQGILFCQSISEKELDFVIVVDDKVSILEIPYLKLTFTANEGQKSVLANYHPGSLSLNQNDYNDIISTSNSKIDLLIPYREITGSKQKTSYFTIQLKKEWLQEQYCILRVYDLSKEVYKKRFKQLGQDLKYTYELDSPNYTFKRVRNH